MARCRQLNSVTSFNEDTKMTMMWMTYMYSIRSGYGAIKMAP